MNTDLTIAEMNRLDATGILERECGGSHDFSVAVEKRNSYTYGECSRCGLRRTEWSDGTTDERS